MRFSSLHDRFFGLHCDTFALTDLHCDSFFIDRLTDLHYSDDG